MPVVLVEVKQEHIDNGIPRQCALCPVAIAFRDYLIADCTIAVNSQVIKLFHGVFEWSATKGGGDRPALVIGFGASLSQRLWEFMDDFDHGRRVKPWSFKFDIPDEFYRKAA